MTQYWCERALVGAGVERNVTIDVVDGRIAAIDSASDRPRRAIELRGMTIPGFANAHSHAFHRALRGKTQAGQGSFWTWRDQMYQVAGRLTPDNYHRLARATFAEMAMAGIVAVGEFHYVHHRPDGTPYDDPNAMGKALLDAASEAGIRITLLDAIYLHGGLDEGGYQPVDGAAVRFSDQSAQAWVERVSLLEDGPSHTIGTAIHSVRAVDPDAMAVVCDWASQRQAPIHAHVSEQVAENEQCVAFHGKTPSEVLSDAGALDRHFTSVHATHLDAEDVSRYATNGVGVCFCPTTERDLGDGIGPSFDLCTNGVEISLGSDSQAVIDMFEEARGIELHERLLSQQRGRFTAIDLLSMATSNGHRSLGWDDAGEIVVGGRADLVTVTLESVRTAGFSETTPIESVLFSATNADITHVSVDGRMIVADGKHLSIDVASELASSIEEVMAS